MMGFEEDLIKYVMKENPTVTDLSTLTTLVFENKEYFEENVKNKSGSGISRRVKQNKRSCRNRKRKRSDSDEEYEPESKKLKRSKIQERNRASLYDSDDSDDDAMEIMNAVNSNN